MPSSSMSRTSEATESQSSSARAYRPYRVVISCRGWISIDTSGAPQPEALQLARGRARQGVHELDRAGVLVRCDLLLGEVLDLLDLHVVAVDAGPQHDVRLDQHAAVLVGDAHHATLLDVGVSEHALLDLGRRDVVPGGDDHVVAARLVPEVAVGVLAERVAGDVPTPLHVDALPVVGEVAAAGGSHDGEPAGRADGGRAAVLVEDRRDVPGYGQACRPRTDVVAGCRDEDVQDLRRADAVDDPEPGGLAEGLPRRDRQVLAR